jgi:hypothetical protein
MSDHTFREKGGTLVPPCLIGVTFCKTVATKVLNLFNKKL